MQAKFRTTQAYWDGRRDDVVASLKRDRLDLIRALEMDIVFVNRVPPVGHQPAPMEQIDEITYRNEKGDLYHISATTHDLMPYWRNPDAYVAPTLESVQEQIDRLLKRVKEGRIEVTGSDGRRRQLSGYGVAGANWF